MCVDLFLFYVFYKYIIGFTLTLVIVLFLMIRIYIRNKKGV